MAVALPVIGSPLSFGETLAWIERVLVMEVRVPLRSAIAAVLAVPPPVVAEIEPLFSMDETLAPASMRTPVTRFAPSVAEAALMVPVLMSVGVDAPAAKRMAVASALFARTATEPSLRTPPSMVTAWPPSTPNCNAVDDTSS
ncbi:hypothetical protein D3C86_1142390 [compost metagenome]